MTRPEPEPYASEAGSQVTDAKYTLKTSHILKKRSPNCEQNSNGDPGAELSLEHMHESVFPARAQLVTGRQSPKDASTNGCIAFKTLFY